MQLPPGNQWPENFNTHENHNFGNGCYVEVDKNFNVRINRFDVYRSFSADYAEQSDIYTAETFTKYAELAKAEPVNKPVYIRTPWDVTDISPEAIIFPITRRQDLRRMQHRILMTLLRFHSPAASAW